MEILHKIVDILIEFVNCMVKSLCWFSNKTTLYRPYMDEELLGKYLRKGTKVKLVEWYEADSIKISTHNFNEGKSKYFGKVVTIMFIDNDGTFTICEGNTKHWFDLQWIKTIKQRTE